MAKKVTVANKAAGKTKKTGFVLPELRSNKLFFIDNFRIQAIIIVIIGALFYVNTYKNFYALDDDIIMKENMYVQKGFAGIGDILSNDAYKSYYQSMGVDQQLSGGRYRPLSIVTFAIEQQLFGKCYGKRMTEVRDSMSDYQRQGINDQRMGDLINERNALTKDIKQTNFDLAPLRHGFQVAYFLISMVLLLYFLRNYIFRKNTDIAFLSVLLFTIHPIHTEVIANVKSRDEIFSLIFITLTFIFYMQYDLTRNAKDAWKGAISFFLAFLSKEYAIVLVALLPASVMIFHKRTLNDVVKTSLPFLAVLPLYFLLRLETVGLASAPVDMKNQDPLNDPYMYVDKFDGASKYATIINRLDDYLWLLIYPVTLVSDYSYQHFPYNTPLDGEVWLSLLVNLGLVVLTVWLFIKRHPMAFALLFYFAFFMLVNNVVFDVGATMGERLIYHSSVGFCMGMAWLIITGIEKLEQAPRNILATLVAVAICIPFFFITVKRNAEWRDDKTLFTADVKKHPNSALCNGNAGARFMDCGLTFLGRDTVIGKDTIHNYGRDSLKVVRYADTAAQYLEVATKLHKRYANGWLNLGLCDFYRGRYQEAADAWGKAYEIFPSNNNLRDYAQLLRTKANDYLVKKDYKMGAYFLHCAARTRPNDARAWQDYAGASFMAMNFTDAREGFHQSDIAYSELIKEAQAQMTQLTQNGQNGTPQYNELANVVNVYTNEQKGLTQGYYASMSDEARLKAYLKDTTNLDSAFSLAQGFMGTTDFYPVVHRLLNKVEAGKPGDVTIKKYQDSLAKLEENLRLAKAADSLKLVNPPKPKVAGAGAK